MSFPAVSPAELETGVREAPRGGDMAPDGFPNSDRAPPDMDCSNVTSPPNTPFVQDAAVRAGVAAKKRKFVEPAKPAAIKRTETGKAASDRQASAQPSRSNLKKGKEPSMIPSEYAKKIQAAYSAQREASDANTPAKPRSSKYRQFLKGKRIYFYGGDHSIAGVSTRNKMNIVRFIYLTLGKYPSILILTNGDCLPISDRETRRHSRPNL